MGAPLKTSPESHGVPFLPLFLPFFLLLVLGVNSNIIFKKAFPASQLLEGDHKLVNYLQSLLEAIVPSGN